MRLDLANLPSDPALLHQLVRDLASEMDQRDSQIEKLRLIIRQLQRGQFGRRSEQLDPHQLQFGLEDLDTDVAQAEAAEPAHAERPVRQAATPRAPFPSHLPREEVTLEIGDDACPRCGGGLHPIGVSTSEMLDWIPASVRVIRIRRPKFGCRTCGAIHQAPAPERLIAKGMATPSLIGGACWWLEPLHARLAANVFASG